MGENACARPTTAAGKCGREVYFPLRDWYANLPDSREPSLSSAGATAHGCLGENRIALRAYEAILEPWPLLEVPELLFVAGHL